MFLQITDSNQSTVSSWEESAGMVQIDQSISYNNNIEVMDLMEILSSYRSIIFSKSVENSDRQIILKLTEATLDCLSKLAELLNDQKMKADILSFISDFKKNLTD